MMYELDLRGVERYVDKLDPASREALDEAVRATIHFILGMRDGACYRYENLIEQAIRQRHEAHRK